MQVVLGRAPALKVLEHGKASWAHYSYFLGVLKW